MRNDTAKRARPATPPAATASTSALPPSDSIPLLIPRRSATIFVSAAATPRSPARPNMDARAIADAHVPNPPTPRYSTRTGFRTAPATRATRVEARVQLVPSRSLWRSELMESDPYGSPRILKGSDVRFRTDTTDDWGPAGLIQTMDLGYSEGRLPRFASKRGQFRTPVPWFLLRDDRALPPVVDPLRAQQAPNESTLGPDP